MKQLLLINIILVLLSATAEAASVSVGTINNINVADMLLGSSNNNCIGNSNGNCHFTNSNDVLLTDAELASVITGNEANYAVNSAAENNAYFELGFNGFNTFNGEGNDLVVFIVGNGSSFGLDVYSTDDVLLSTDTYSVGVEDTVFNDLGQWLCVGNEQHQCPNGYALSAVFIDFGNSFAGDVALGKLHFSLNGSAFSLAGGFHTQASATVVPLPLPAVLFSSGLLLLSWVGRRKTS